MQIYLLLAQGELRNGYPESKMPIFELNLAFL